MKKVFMCSLCISGIIGGALYLDEDSLTYRTNKLTVNPAYRNLVLSIDQIQDITWKWFLFPTATFRMKNGDTYKMIIFNKNRFMKCFRNLCVKE